MKKLVFQIFCLIFNIIHHYNVRFLKKNIMSFSMNSTNKVTVFNEILKKLKNR